MYKYMAIKCEEITSSDEHDDDDVVGRRIICYHFLPLSFFVPIMYPGGIFVWLSGNAVMASCSTPENGKERHDVLI